MSILTIENLSKECGNLKLLKDVNLSVLKGNCIAIKCSNEIGELFFDIIFGKVAPSKGNVYFENTSVNECYHIEKEISIVFKDEGMYERSKVSEYISFFKKIYNFKYSTKDLMIKLGLIDIENRKIKTLTYSQKKRLSLVRAMLSNPKLILIQEPTLNLDRESALIIREFIPYICSLGISIIAISVSLEDIILLNGESYILDENGLTVIESDIPNNDENKKLCKRDSL
ncbi:ATP-binding cassette domain-containing protein [Clostridium thailandense]|uniref:ABC transporter ATP-binding protein n=1 Tax=Clostridium thailandense TaxID=2794346 RepID=UPI003989C619